MAGVGKETVPGVRGIYRLILNTLWGGVLSVYDKGYILYFRCAVLAPNSLLSSKREDERTVGRDGR